MSRTNKQPMRVYVTPETKQKIKEKAEEEGLKSSSWMRSMAKKHLDGEEA